MDFVLRHFDFHKHRETVAIAEVGVNHNGDPRIARQLVDAAVKAGVDIVKFQAFRSEKEISRLAAKTPYQVKATSSGGNQLEMAKALELSGPVLKEMKEYCTSAGMPFLCTEFDFDSVDLLVEDLKVETIKVPSGEVTNLPFLDYVEIERPQGGVAPADLWKVLGKTLKNEIEEDAPINWEDLS